MTIEAHNSTKTIRLLSFPEPEVLSIETDFKYYDKKDGIFNRFGVDDLTNLNKEAKTHILEKVPESGLIDRAKTEALDSVMLIEAIVETIGWKLDYKTLALPEVKKMT